MRAVVLAAVIVTVAVLLVVLLVTLVVLDDGWTKVIWTVIGALLLWQLVPRPARPSSRAVPVRADDAPGLHGLVAEVAAVTGTRRPDSVVVDTAYATSLLPVGYLGRATLVLGLPQWTALDDDERIAVLAHELACVEPARSPAGILVRLADDLLSRLVLMLSPTGAVQPHETTREQYDSQMGAMGAGDDLAGDRMRREVATSVGAAGLTVVAAPARALQGMLRRAALAGSSPGCLRADRGAAALVGSPAVTGLLLSTLPLPRAWVAAEVAARRRADPFVAMAASERPARGRAGPTTGGGRRHAGASRPHPRSDGHPCRGPPAGRGRDPGSRPGRRPGGRPRPRRAPSPARPALRRGARPRPSVTFVPRRERMSRS